VDIILTQFNIVRRILCGNTASLDVRIDAGFQAIKNVDSGKYDFEDSEMKGVSGCKMA
jgi:hypothetical protein